MLAAKSAAARRAERAKIARENAELHERLQNVRFSIDNDPTDEGHYALREQVFARARAKREADAARIAEENALLAERLDGIHFAPGRATSPGRQHSPGRAYSPHRADGPRGFEAAARPPAVAKPAWAEVAPPQLGAGPAPSPLDAPKSGRHAALEREPASAQEALRALREELAMLQAHAPPWLRAQEPSSAGRLQRPASSGRLQRPSMAPIPKPPEGSSRRRAIEPGTAPLLRHSRR